VSGEENYPGRVLQQGAVEGGVMRTSSGNLIGLARASGVLLLTALLVPGTARAQTSMGGVSGTVTDAQSAVVPGATVTLVSDATNVQAVRQTNAGGYFNFVNVRPGTYTLTVELTGFNTAKISGFTVGVNETVSQNVALKIGAATETVEVTAQSELLQATSAALGQVVEEKVIRSLPLQGRNFTSLLLLTPGTNPVSTAQGPQSETAVNSFEGNSGIPGGQIANASIQGQQNRSKVYYVDGIINTSVRSGTYVALPDIDALQEFKVQSQSDKAEYGGVLGGVVNMTSKSGSNAFHGSVFGYGRNQNFAARNPFRDVRNGQAVEHPEYKQAQFGVNVGGPIVQDKTFFFASYDGWRYRDKADIRLTVPTSRELNGDFSQSATGRVIYNPYTTRIENGRVVRDPFPGNIIPANLISPTMQAFLRAYMVQPNVAGSVRDNFVANRDQSNDSNAFQVRLDHHFSSRDSIFVRWTERRISAIIPRGDLGFIEPDSINRNAGGGWFHSFSPNVILEARGGIATQPTEDAPAQHPAGFEPLRGLNLPELDRFQGYIVSSIGAPWTGTSGQAIPVLGVQGPRPRGNPNWNVAADLTWLRGNHSFKFGFQRLQISRLQKNQFGEITFAADQTRNPQSTANTGDPIASALLGLPTNIRGFVPDFGFIDFKTATMSGYIQDQWQVKPNLTVNLGLRYDYVTRAVGNGDRTLQSGPDMDTGEWLIALPEMPGVCERGAPTVGCLPAPLSTIQFKEFIRVTGERDSILPAIKDNLGPRIGVAWSVNPKTVVRAGYGLFWDSMVARSQYAQHQFETWGWPQFSGIDTGNINVEGVGPLQRVDNIASLPFGAPRANPWTSGNFFNDPDRKNAYSHQWHVEVQRQFTKNLMMGAAYVGSYNGRMEYAGRPQAPPVAAIDASGRRLTPAERDRLRPWPHMTGTFTYSDDIGMAKYNSFQFKAQQRFSEGLSSMLSYTYSRTIDTSSGWFNAEGGIGSGATVQNWHDIDANRALSSYDIPHILTWATVWELPVGQGKRWLNSGPASWILGNWQLNWFLLARSGQPFTVTVGGDPANLGHTGYSRANLVGDPNVSNPTVDQWFNTAAFAVPVNSFGNMERNSLRAPGFWNVDLGVQKNVPLGRDRSLQLRVEAFNVFNHINWGNPGVAQDNAATFGRISSMSGRPRQLQFGLRMSF
jgi:outer membrane receptor protein involved in Fe transport